MPEESPQKLEEKDEKASWNLKLADIIIQTFAGGSIGTFATLLNSSDLPKLALGGVIGGGVAPIVFAVAEPISKKLKQGAGFLGEATASSTEDTAQKWWTGLSGFERKYLQALQSYCYALEVEGFRGNLPPLALADVYIPLRLDTDRSNVYGQAKIDTEIWHFLPQAESAKQSPLQNRLAVIAYPGYGKTTLTRYLALSYSCPTYKQKGAAKLLPVLLRFRDIHGLIQSETQPKLEVLIVQMIKGLPTCSELPVTEPWMKQQLKNGKCLVMLDGLDEAPEDQRETLSRWTNRQMQEYSSFFIFTSRPHGYDASLFQGVRQLGILDFTNSEKRNFLQKWYRVERWRNKWEILFKESQKKNESECLSEQQAKAQSDDEAKQAAADLYKQIAGNMAINTQLAVNPLLLTIIAAMHNAFDALPERRAHLYRKMFDLLLEDRPNRCDTRLKLKEAAQNQAVLQALALSLTQADKTQFNRERGT
ncbi:MAG: NACHT domain-containing protein [Pseudanabaenales cyanobacterium]|nr:NACHT domain-containing protein [Pseudanabaenales cyanobacterium]